VVIYRMAQKVCPSLLVLLPLLVSEYWPTQRFLILIMLSHLDELLQFLFCKSRMLCTADRNRAAVSGFSCHCTAGGKQALVWRGAHFLLLFSVCFRDMNGNLFLRTEDVFADELPIYAAHRTDRRPYNRSMTSLTKRLLQRSLLMKLR
jgi:hypothetical protein